MGLPLPNLSALASRLVMTCSRRVRSQRPRTAGSARRCKGVPERTDSSPKCSTTSRVMAAEVHLLEVEVELALLDAGDGEELVDEAGEAADLPPGVL